MNKSRTKRKEGKEGAGTQRERREEERNCREEQGENKK